VYKVAYRWFLDTWLKNVPLNGPVGRASPTLHMINWPNGI
jgi:hypothetical protein